MSTITLYHNPRCSKSREALKLLRDAGVEPEVVNYLENPLDAPAIHDLLNKLGVPAEDLVRKNEPLWKELGPPPTRHGGAPAPTEEATVAQMAAHPILMQRPVAVRGERAVIGRPPERVLELLAD